MFVDSALHLLHLRLVHEQIRIHHTQIILIRQRVHLGEFHEAGQLQNHPVIVHALRLRVLAGSAQDLTGSHLHGIDTETFLDILTQRIRDQGVIPCFVLAARVLLFGSRPVP